MTAATRKRSTRKNRGARDGLTFEEFVDLIPDGQKADLIDGVIYMASPDNTEAADLNGWLGLLIYGFVEAQDLGKVYQSRVAYRIGPNRGPEPDLGFVPKEQEHTRRYGYIDGPPALAIEIVSPDSVERDYVDKRQIYEEAGVQEYWIVDPNANRVTFLVLHKGKFRKVSPVKHIFRSTVLPGLWIDVRWLLSDKRPRAIDVLQNLLKVCRP